MRLGLPMGQGTRPLRGGAWGEAWEHHLSHSGPSQCGGVLVKASCVMMWAKTIVMHKIKLRRFSIYFSFLGYVTLQFLTIFCLIFLYMEHDSCPPLSHCFVPSSSSRMFFSQEL